MNSYIPVEQRGEPWFDDGNILLITQDPRIAFRVHRGILARRSEFFRDMFQFPQPANDTIITYEDCQVVEIYDKPSELSNLFKAIYDGVSFNNNCLEDFFYLSGILRLSTKYLIGHLRTQAIQYLTRTWAYTLKGHDEMVEAALNAPSVDGRTYPYVHPLHVLNLAREADVSIIVPSAFYFLSIYSLSDILKGDHPKLAVEHSSKPSSMLETSDIKYYTLMFQHRLQVIHDFVHRFCGERATGPLCTNSKLCGRAFSRLFHQLSRSWAIKTGPFRFMTQAAREITRDSMICETCRTSFQQDADNLREKIWSELPSIVGLPSWTELATMDLNL